MQPSEYDNLTNIITTFGPIIILLVHTSTILLSYSINFHTPLSFEQCYPLHHLSSVIANPYDLIHVLVHSNTDQYINLAIYTSCPRGVNR